MKKANIKKIVLATRTDKVGFPACKKGLGKLLSNNDTIEKVYIIGDFDKDDFIIGNIKCKVLYNNQPIRPTAFNVVIDELNREKNQKYHLLTYSKEVYTHKKHINKMLKTIEDNKDKLIVVGYRLKDDVSSKNERKIFANGSYLNNNVGIAYKIPWNTCALWNKKFVYGENGMPILRFDDICDKNQLGQFVVKVNGENKLTDYEGMEDGLAIAELITKNEKLKYKLFEEELFWDIEDTEERIIKHKIKLARKNIVLSTLMMIKGYSIDKLIAAQY